MYNGSVSNSGGGSIDPNDENYVEYLDISGYEKDGNEILGAILEIILICNGYYKTTNDGLLCIFSSSYCVMLGQEFLLEMLNNTKAICLMPNAKIMYIEKELQSFYELLKKNKLDEFYNSIPRITKEQFYNLEQ